MRSAPTQHPFIDDLRGVDQVSADSVDPGATDLHRNSVVGVTAEEHGLCCGVADVAVVPHHDEIATTAVNVATTNVPVDVRDRSRRTDGVAGG